VGGSIKEFVVEFLEKRSVKIENIVYDRWKLSGHGLKPPISFRLFYENNFNEAL